MEIVEVAAYKIKLINSIKLSSEYMKRKFRPQMLIIDSFHTYISPVFHTKIPKKLNNLLNIDIEALNKGIPYEDAIHKLTVWAGDNALFICWSDNDRKMIEKNNELLLSTIPCYMDFVNLQYLYDINYHKRKRTGLTTATNEIGYKFMGKPHNALDDSFNMLSIFEKLMESNTSAWDFY